MFPKFAMMPWIKLIISCMPDCMSIGSICTMPLTKLVMI